MPEGSIVVAHRTPRRFRLRLVPAERTPEALHALQRKLDTTVGITRTEVNVTTGSVLVHHEADAVFEDLLERAGLSADVLIAALPPRLRGEVRGEASLVAARITDRFLDADVRLARATGGWLDLKMAIPLGLLGAAVWRAAEGVALFEVPPYILLWYAFDSFIKFHQPTIERTAAAGWDTSHARDSSQQAALE